MSTGSIRRRERPARITIHELAAHLGVSPAAVSFALNGKPGVSEATRARIIAAAEQWGWEPSAAARALSGQGTGSVGLVLARPAGDLSRDAFYLRFIAGLQAELSPQDVTLTFQLVDSLEAETVIYRRWTAQQRVDGAVVVDLRSDDPRPGLLVDLGLPAVLVGAREHRGGRLPVVWADDEGPTVDLVCELLALGHRRIGYVSGPESFTHTRSRVRAYARAMHAAGLSDLPAIRTDYSPEQGARALDRLWPLRPSAIVADSDQLALGVLRRAGECGIDVPGDLSIVSWEDTPLCEATTPTLAALRRDPFTLGRRAALALLAGIAGREVDDEEFDSPTLERRGSLGAAVG
ncbi:LacI family DNA-binding transcriptional regulator [Pseudactinotalea sp. HY160]|uniref:LacI family DNA-binding transcriptional regulator n=1 Tax=Pseudactinotalea sp. HY160 TaxID=2654490 RepID=UPI00128BEE20|nr:LacI family DNA-binding transcriptional regulator [Pseudactinotalea sp. HY160]MPV50358.1 LacI family DNA-binding transcriptional regulator [Pseudactinotalea sp. HY160]